MSVPTTASTRTPGAVWAAPPARRFGVLTCLRWELVKLGALVRVRITLGLCAVAPFVFVFLLNRAGQLPKDSLYGRWVKDTGFAVPLLMLGFVGLWVFPLLTSLVAGDIFATEDQHGTWKTLLTRSRSRSAVFWGKTLAASVFATAVIAISALASLAAGVVMVGREPLESATGTLISPGAAARLDLQAWACAWPSLLGFTALALMVSVLARNAALGVVTPVVIGGLMQLYAFLNGTDAVRHVMLSTGFDSWHGLAIRPAHHGDVITALFVGAGWTAACLTVARTVFRRRDVTGG